MPTNENKLWLHNGTDLYYHDKANNTWGASTVIAPIISNRNGYVNSTDLKSAINVIQDKIDRHIMKTLIENMKTQTWANPNSEVFTETMKKITNKSIMPNIEDYKWNAETGVTYIKWSDKTETTVRAEDPTTADQFVGFMLCYAKRAAGNTSRINNLYDKWAVRKPIQDKKAEAKALAEKKEKDRIAAKRKKEREDYLVYREALRIKRDYEARKLANEKFGVPIEEIKQKENQTN